MFLARLCASWYLHSLWILFSVCSYYLDSNLLGNCLSVQCPGSLREFKAAHNVQGSFGCKKF